MANELVDAYQRASDDDAVGAIVVTGAGKAFCAGMDLSIGGNVFGLDETMDPSLAEQDARWDDPAIVNGVRDTGGRVSLAVYDCKKPVIAAINGAAVGIGATMTLPMDVRLASDKARIGFVFGRIGIVPEACSTWFLPRIVGLQQALDWVYAADILTPQQALDGRLLKAVVPHEQLLDEAHALAHRYIDGRSPVAIALDAPDAAAQPRRAAPAPGACGGVAGHAAHQPPRRQGRRGQLQRQARAGVHRPGVDRPAGLLPLVVSQPVVRAG
jgi:enoyl-CoA hydratase/carnithine racemase